MKAEEIERMFPWGPAKLVPTRYGPRLLRRVEGLTQAAYDTFLAREAELSRRGVKLEYDGLGKHLVWWQKVKEEVPPEQQARTEFRDILNNDLAATCEEVKAKGGWVCAAERVRNGYRLTITWPAETKGTP